MLIDTHCHPFLSKEKPYINTFNNFINNSWNYLISIWIDLKSSKKSIELSKKYDFIYSTIWIHPNYSKTNTQILELKKLYLENKEKIVWIWECWYDYFHINKNNIVKKKKTQKLLFEAQIELAKELWLPVIVHSRKASEDTLNTLKTKNCKNFIIHSFSENLDIAKKYIDFSPECMIWFNWIITFKNALDIQNTAKNIPLRNIIIETDSPYLTPVPFRWKEENEPIYIKYILDKIIELRNEDKEEITKSIFENSLKIFKI